MHCTAVILVARIVPPRRRPRRGLSLVETVAVMAAVAMLSGLAATTLAMLLRADSTLRDRAAEGPQLSAFATALRRDVARAEKVEWREGERTLRLALPEGELLEYRQFDNRWVREASRVDAREAESPTLTAAHPLPGNGACTVDPAAAAAGELLRLRLARDAEAIDAANGRGFELEVIVQVGRDRELLHR